MKQLPKPIRVALTVSAVCVLITLVFAVYLVFIGIPRTQARNYYNKGILSIQKGEIRAGLDDFKIAVSYWPEPYIIEEINRLENLE